MSTIKDFFGGGSDLSEIKGTGWNSDDTLKTINDKTEIIKNTTTVIRADTGELNGSAILDLYVTNDLVLTGNITVKKLHVSDGAHITGNYTIVVNESCYIYSSYVNINTLDIRGNLTCKRKIGDTSTTCNITLTNLYVLGNYNVENTNVTVSNEAYIVGETNSDNCSENYNKFIAENNVIITNGRTHSGTRIINGNIDIDCDNFNQSNITDKLIVHGNCTFTTTPTCNHINDWEIHGTLTLPDLNCNGQINIQAENFIFNGTKLESNSNTSGVRGGKGGRTENASGQWEDDYPGGLCSWIELIISQTFTAPNLTTIKSKAGNGGCKDMPWNNWNFGGSAGGSVHGNIFINTTNFNNIVEIIFTPGSGAYYGADGVINSNGIDGNGDNSNYRSGGGGSAGFIGGAGGSIAKNWDHLNPGYSGPNFDVTGNILIQNELNAGHTENVTGGTVDHNTKTIPDLTELYPNVPTLITENNVINPTALEFMIPTFPEDIDFDFEIYIEKQLTEKIHELVIAKNTNDNPNDFSGTAPYLQGSGNVSFTLSTLDSSIYRWKVKCMKDSDTSIASIYSDWRYFTISS